MVKISIVFGTLQRRPYLEKAIESIRRSVGKLIYEIIVVDGGSTDGTQEYLSSQGDVVFIEQGTKLGACAAFNEGFRKAQGEYVAAFNDDAEYTGDELARACKLLDDRPEVGQVAIPFSVPDEPPHIAFVNLWGLQLPYANFGVIRRDLGRQLNWWEGHFQYAGDTELSIKVWAHNLRVAPLIHGHIIHHQLKDDTRIPNVESKSLSIWNTAPIPEIVRQMRRGLPRIPTSKNRKQKYHSKPPNHSTRPKFAGVEGMSLVKYIGNGLIAKGLSGTEYKFSGGACLYVADEDLQTVFQQVRQGESLRVV